MQPPPNDPPVHEERTEPANVPGANVVFVRSKDEAALEKEKEELLRAS
jgi:hypothetical protein